MFFAMAVPSILAAVIATGLPDSRLLFDRSEVGSKGSKKFVETDEVGVKARDKIGPRDRAKCLARRPDESEAETQWKVLTLGVD